MQGAWLDNVDVAPKNVVGTASRWENFPTKVADTDRHVHDRTVAFVDGSRAGVEAKVRASRRSGRDDTKSRVRRVETLVHLGELSAGRQALDGAEMAPGNLATLAQLTNPERRPPVPRDLLSGSATAVPERPFELDPELFCKNVRSARRGAASGMSVEHILGLVESDHDMDIFCSFATIVSQGHVPRGVLEGLRSLMEAFEASLSDIIRRLIARTIAQQISKGRGSDRTTPVRIADEVRV